MNLIETLIENHIVKIGKFFNWKKTGRRKVYIYSNLAPIDIFRVQTAKCEFQVERNTRSNARSGPSELLQFSLFFSSLNYN